MDYRRDRDGRDRPRSGGRSFRRDDGRKWQGKSRSSDDMVYGLRPVMEALSSAKEIERITISDSLNREQVAEVKQVAKQRGVPVKTVPQAWFNRLGNRNHQGIVASVSPITYQPLEQLLPLLYDQGLEPLIIIADGITDVRNLGAIVRTAECAGASGLIVPKRGTAHINAAAVKTSAGALMHFPVCRVDSIPEACQYLKDSGLRLVAASEKGSTYYHRASLGGPLGLILGDEYEGVSPRLLDMCDETVRIPIRGQVESLNVSVSAGIILYEIERQRQL